MRNKHTTNIQPTRKKLPRVKELSTEYGQVLQQKKELYQEYKEVRKEMNTWAAAKSNTKIILGIDERNVRVAFASGDPTGDHIKKFSTV